MLNHSYWNWSTNFAIRPRIVVTVTTDRDRCACPPPSLDSTPAGVYFIILYLRHIRWRLICVCQIQNILPRCLSHSENPDIILWDIILCDISHWYPKLIQTVCQIFRKHIAHWGTPSPNPWVHRSSSRDLGTQSAAGDRRCDDWTLSQQLPIEKNKLLLNLYKSSIIKDSQSSDVAQCCSLFLWCSLVVYI